MASSGTVLDSLGERTVRVNLRSDFGGISVWISISDCRHREQLHFNGFSADIAAT